MILSEQHCSEYRCLSRNSFFFAGLNDERLCKGPQKKHSEKEREHNITWLLSSFICVLRWNMESISLTTNFKGISTNFLNCSRCWKCRAICLESTFWRYWPWRTHSDVFSIYSTRIGQSYLSEYLTSIIATSVDMGKGFTRIILRNREKMIGSSITKPSRTVKPNEDFPCRHLLSWYG